MVDGAKLYVPFGTDKERVVAASRLHDGLNLLARYDSVRHGRVLRELTAVVVLRDMVAAASIDEQTRVCMISGTQIRDDKSGLATAILLVHESTHGMLIRRGVRVGVQNRGRIERCCIELELSFVQHLPQFVGKDRIVEEIKINEANAISADYSLSTRQARLANKLLDIGWPSWLVGIVARNR